jgi:hypothetical protein
VNDYTTSSEQSRHPQLTGEELLRAIEEARARLPEPGVCDVTLLRSTTEVAGKHALVLRARALEGTEAEQVLKEAGWQDIPDLFNFRALTSRAPTSKARRWRTWHRVVVGDAELVDSLEQQVRAHPEFKP